MSDFSELAAKYDTHEEALSALHAAGATPVQAIKAMIGARSVSHRDAKQRLLESPSWHEWAKLHGRLGTQIDELDAEFMGAAAKQEDLSNLTSDEIQHLIAAWENSAEQLRHFDNIFWASIRYYTSLVAMFVAGSGAVFGIPAFSQTERTAIAVAFLIVGSVLAIVGGFIAKKQGEYIGHVTATCNIAELAVVQNLKLAGESKDYWMHVRKLREQLHKDPDIAGPVRKVVPRSFAVLGYLMLGAALMLAVASVVKAFYS